jgi:hypothetical protein
MKNLKEVKMIELESVGSVINPQNGIVYPQLINDAYDMECGVELEECSDEWFDSLSEEDMNLLIGNGLYQFLK